VKVLGLVWSYNLESTRVVEATPLVVDGIVYVSASWGIVHATDVRSGKKIWTYDPKVPREIGYKGCCDVVNRGVALYEGKVFVASFDGRLIALDAATGNKVWEKDTIVDHKFSYTITGAPRVFKGKVIIGNGGAEYGVRGYITAYDAKTGEQKWRWFTVPGDPSQPFEDESMERAAKTWDPAGKWWEAGGGGTAWDTAHVAAGDTGMSAPPRQNSCRPDRTKNPGGGDEGRQWLDTDKHSKTKRWPGCCHRRARRWRWSRAKLVWERERWSVGARMRSPGPPEGGPGLRAPGLRP
jgi:quinohemoprotein ethanol dehydrogenase